MVLSIESVYYRKKYVFNNFEVKFGNFALHQSLQRKLKLAFYINRFLSQLRLREIRIQQYTLNIYVSFFKLYILQHLKSCSLKTNWAKRINISTTQ